MWLASHLRSGLAASPEIGVFLIGAMFKMRLPMATSILGIDAGKTTSARSAIELISSRHAAAPVNPI